MTMSQRLDSSPGSRPAKSMLIVSAFTPQTSANPLMTSTSTPTGGCPGVCTNSIGGKLGSTRATSFPPCTKLGAAASAGAPATTSPSNSSPNPVLTTYPPSSAHAGEGACFVTTRREAQLGREVAGGAVDLLQRRREF